MSRETWVKGGNEPGVCLRRDLPERGCCRCKGPEVALPGLFIHCSFSSSTPRPLGGPPPGHSALCSCDSNL